MSGMNLVILSSAVLCSVFIKENLSGLETREIGGLQVFTGKLNGRPVTLFEIEEDNIPLTDENLLDGLQAGCLISLGESYSCKKNLASGDMVVSSGATFLDKTNSNQAAEAKADLKLVDLGLKAAERFINEEGLCKVIVGKVFIDPGTDRSGRKLTFMPRHDVYCIDRNGYPVTQWVADGNVPFVLVRTIVPAGWNQKQELEVTQFKWDMAKRNFWIVRGIVEALKKKTFREKTRKVDLI